jgi:hypothetical protein
MGRVRLYGVWVTRGSLLSDLFCGRSLNVRRTGYGYHADYMMGWPEDVLQKAMSTCNSSGGAVSACRALTERTEQDMNDCAIPNRVEEDLDGC